MLTLRRNVFHLEDFWKNAEIIGIDIIVAVS